MKKLTQSQNNKNKNDIYPYGSSRATKINEFETSISNHLREKNEIEEVKNIELKEKQKMETNKSKEDVKMPGWDDILTEQLPAVELFDNEEHILTFLVDKPYETMGKTYGKPIKLFNVMEDGVEKTLIASSIRLVVALKKFSPLKDRTLGIQSNGQMGIKRDYSVRDINQVKTEKVK